MVKNHIKKIPEGEGAQKLDGAGAENIDSPGTRRVGFMRKMFKDRIFALF